MGESNVELISLIMLMKSDKDKELNCHQDNVLLDFAATPTTAANHEPIREFNNPQAAWAKLFHARTTLPLTLQIDHHEYVEDLTSSKLESKSYFAAYKTLSSYWQMSTIRLFYKEQCISHFILHLIYGSRALVVLCTGVIS